MLLLTQRGTPTLYYGDEIGMRGVDDSRPSRPSIRRAAARAAIEIRRARRCSGAASRTRVSRPSSRGCRSALDRDVANVASQSRDAGSLLTLYRRLLELRAAEPVLQDGVQEALTAGPALVAYRRRGAARRLLVVLELRARAGRASRCGDDAPGRVLLSTFLDREGERVGDQVALRADEGLLIALD